MPGLGDHIKDKAKDTPSNSRAWEQRRANRWSGQLRERESRLETKRTKERNIVCIKE